MPLDQEDYVSTGDQRLLKLARALRDSNFPPALKWNYQSCSTCAIEVARYIFGYECIGEFLLVHEDFLGLDSNEAGRIFSGAHRKLGISRMCDVQPKDVAKVIEAHVAAKINA